MSRRYYTNLPSGKRPTNRKISVGAKYISFIRIFYSNNSDRNNDDCHDDEVEKEEG